MEEKKSYFAVIPAEVRYCKELTPNAKLLYGEFTALSNEKGYCWASNNYFAELYEVKAQAISKWINQLARLGFVRLEYIYSGKEIKQRNIYINSYQQIVKEVSTNDEEGINKKRGGYQQKERGVSTKREEGINKKRGGYQQKDKENNTVNNTNNNTVNNTNNAKALLFMQKFNEIMACNLGLTDNNKKDIEKLWRQFKQSEIEITEENITNYLENFKNMIKDWGEGFEKQIKNLPLLSRHFNQILDYKPNTKKKSKQKDYF